MIGEEERNFTRSLSTNGTLNIVYDKGFRAGQEVGFKEGFDWACVFLTPFHSLRVWMQRMGRKLAGGFRI